MKHRRWCALDTIDDIQVCGENEKYSCSIISSDYTQVFGMCRWLCWLWWSLKVAWCQESVFQDVAYLDTLLHLHVCGIGSSPSWLNTCWNCLFRMSAFSLLSVLMICWLLFRTKHHSMIRQSAWRLIWVIAKQSSPSPAWCAFRRKPVSWKRRNSYFRVKVRALVWLCFYYISSLLRLDNQFYKCNAFDLVHTNV